MQCPIDHTDLKRTEREGVEIDYCPACRGVWLDRGELEKIIDRSGSAHKPASRPQSRKAGIGSPDAKADEATGSSERVGRRSFLAELFDF